MNASGKVKKSGKAQGARGWIGTPQLKRKLKLATVSLASRRENEDREAREQDFVGGVAAAATRKVDLIVTAGVSLPRRERSARLMEASGGVPVLYETYHSEVVTWTLQCLNEQPLILRHRQLIETSADEAASHHQLWAAVRDGQGVIDIEGSRTRLVLLICGENNFMSRAPESSIAARPGEGAPPQVLCGSWIALNPAHRPYGRYARAKLEEVDGRGPVFPRIVRTPGKLGDGTVAPSAIVHCNTFSPRQTALSRSRVSARFVLDSCDCKPRREQAAFQVDHWTVPLVPA